MTLTQQTALGTAEMTYSIDGSADQSLSGSATTFIWYDAGEPVQAYLELNFMTLYVSFGVDPFTGTGSYSSLPYFMFTDPALLNDNCHGFWTTPEDGPAPILDVTAFTVSDHIVWGSSLSADLVWYVEDCDYPPAKLNASTVAISARPVQSPAAAPSAGFADTVREETTKLARRIGVNSYPA